ncbi:MAG: hypothetical protein R3B48_18475 [Kofleriaceae bacterium]
MSELAFNVNGEGFDVPPHATGWRVRRMKQKGAPEVVYGRDGLPLVLPIHAEIEDLKQEVPGPGRYRLDPLDDNQKAIAESPSGYVVVHPESLPGGAVTSGRGERGTVAEGVLVEAMRMNTELARSVIDRFPVMMEAAAVLLRAADGAGIPARVPLAQGGVPGGTGSDEDGEAEDGPAPVAGFDLNALIAQLVPPLVVAVTSGRLKVPGLGSMLDWRKAAPTVETGKEADRTEVAKAAPSEAGRGGSGRTSDPAGTNAPAVASATEDAMPVLDPGTMAHFVAVQQALSEDERAVAQALVAELSPRDLRAWLAELAPLSVDEAVAKIRTVLHAQRASASASGGAS